MKKISIFFLIFYLPCTKTSFGQSEEVQQLLLNVEKLTQFKQILKDLKQGYEIVSTGYETIKNISQGNFDMHQSFLDGLLAVSPVVRKYRRVSDIIDMQLQIVKGCKSAFKRFKNDGQFTIEELDFLSKTYNNLFKQSLNSLDELATVLTAGKLRMTDDERLHFIDKIFDNIQDELIFIQHFNSSASILVIQRKREQWDVDVMRRIYNVK